MNKFVKNSLIIIMSAFIGFGISEFFDFKSRSNTTVENQDISRFELKLRKVLKSKKGEVHYTILRKKDQLMVEIYGENFFSNNHWMISNEGQSFIQSFKYLTNEINKKFELEILGENNSDNFNKVNNMAIRSFRASNVASLLVGEGVYPHIISIKGTDTKVSDYGTNKIKMVFKVKERV